MNKNQLEEICKSACDIVKVAGTFILEQAGKVGVGQIETKAHNSLVSFVDKESERILVNGLSKILPNSTFLTEEETVKQEEGPLRWIIDPLDGTTNFLHQLPCYNISVALQVEDELAIGIVLDVQTKDLFYGWTDGGAYLNGKPISVRRNITLADCMVSTGFPYYDFGMTDQYLASLKELMQKTRGIRRVGAAAIDLAYVAAGRYDTFYEYSLQPYDVAAGIVLIREAGGLVNDFEGNQNYLFGKQIVASSPDVHQEILDILLTHF